MEKTNIKIIVAIVFLFLMHTPNYGREDSCSLKFELPKKMFNRNTTDTSIIRLPIIELKNNRRGDALKEFLCERAEIIKDVDIFDQTNLPLIFDLHLIPCNSIFQDEPNISLDFYYKDEILIDISNLSKVPNSVENSVLRIPLRSDKDKYVYYIIERSERYLYTYIFYRFFNNIQDSLNIEFIPNERIQSILIENHNSIVADTIESGELTIIQI